MTYDENPQFVDAYWASQPPEVQKLRAMPEGLERSTLAMSLATSGFVIDGPIMLWNWDPWKMMNIRQSYGFTWVPSVLQPPIEIIPGKIDWKHVPYDPLNPPAHSIKVSTNLGDYPPFAPPAPLPVPSSGSYVGPLVWGNFYGALPGDPAKDGQKVVDPRGTFLKHQLSPGGPMSGESWYTKETLAV